MDNPIASINGSRDAVASQARHRLAAVVLLAGSVRPSELRRVAGRPILDLPLAAGQSLGREWRRRMQEFRRAVSREDLPLIITANAISGVPRDVAMEDARGGGSNAETLATVRMDSEEPRGSGGALRDIAAGMDPDRSLLVASAHMLLRAPIGPVLESLARFDDDVLIHADEESRPTGLFLIRCDALRGLPSHGFVDLKEQAIPSLAAGFRVRVVRDPGPAPIAVRTLRGYLAAVRAAARPGAAQRSEAEEDSFCTFALAEADSQVDPTAGLHDSVVLGGARVGARASIVRSLVGPGAAVPPGARIIDELLPRSEQHR